MTSRAATPHHLTRNLVRFGLGWNCCHGGRRIWFSGRIPVSPAATHATRGRTERRGAAGCAELVPKFELATLLLHNCFCCAVGSRLRSAVEGRKEGMCLSEMSMKSSQEIRHPLQYSLFLPFPIHFLNPCPIGPCQVGRHSLHSCLARCKRIMHRKVVSPAPPPGVGDGMPAMEGTLGKPMSAREKMENCDKQKMAKILRACLLAKYLRNDNVPCELQQGLYLGSIGAAFNKGLLHNLNVTHILSVANAVDMPFPQDFTYLRIDVLDSADVDLTQHFNTCFSFIDEARMAGGGVLVHCFAGRSRSVTVAVAYLMRTYGMRFVQALSHVTSRRKEAQPNPGFIRQLQNYDHHLEETRRSGK